MRLTYFVNRTFTPLLFLMATLSLSAAPILPHTDTFETGAENWTNGSAPDPGTVLGGPDGAADHYLQIAGDGSGAGGRMTAFNRVQWAGDYSGIGSIVLDVLNTNSFALSIRIAMKLGTASSNEPGISSNAILVNPDGQWHRLVFDLLPGNFTELNGATFASTIPNVAELRVLHALTPRLKGDQKAGVLSVDNITAIATPEPAAFGPVAGGLAAAAAGLLFRRRAGRSLVLAAAPRRNC